MDEERENAIKLSKQASSKANSEESEDSRIVRQPWGMGGHSYLLLMHLSLLSGFVVPMGGMVIPLVMWLVNKDDYPLIDQHGKLIANWIISYTIYLIVCVILGFAGIGLLLIAALKLCEIIFVVIAAMKASRGELWRYPLSIQFIR